MPTKLSGQTVLIKSGQFKGVKYRIEGLWKDVAGISWGSAEGNPACLEFALRTAFEQVSLSECTDSKVYYGKIGGLGKLMPECQLGEVVPDEG